MINSYKVFGCYDCTYGKSYLTKEKCYTRYDPSCRLNIDLYTPDKEDDAYRIHVHFDLHIFGGSGWTLEEAEKNTLWEIKTTLDQFNAMYDGLLNNDLYPTIKFMKRYYKNNPDYPDFYVSEKK
jgi:hypothetical protein